MRGGIDSLRSAEEAFGLLRIPLADIEDATRYLSRLDDASELRQALGLEHDEEALRGALRRERREHAPRTAS